MRYDITVKQIQNGWLYTIELPGFDPQTQYCPTEIQALAGAQSSLEVAIQNVIKQTQKESSEPHK